MEKTFVPKNPDESNHISHSDNRRNKLLDILLKDYDAIRSEIRTAESRHEKVTFWLSSGLLAATAKCFNDFEIGFTFMPLVILAYYAHRLYSHTLHVAMLSQWIMRIEELVDKLLNTEGLLDWERTFARQNLKNFSFSSIISPHYVTEGFLLLPSFIVFIISVAYGAAAATKVLGLSPLLSKILVWGGYPILFLGLWILFFITGSNKALDKARKDSIEKTLSSIINGASNIEQHNESFNSAMPLQNNKTGADTNPNIGHSLKTAIMKKWAFLVVCFYLLTLVILGAPLFFFCLEFPSKNILNSLLSTYRSAWFWGYILIMVLGQALLLLPLGVNQTKLTPKRKLFIPVITSAFMFMLLIAGILSSLAFAVWGDNTFNFLDDKNGNLWTAVILFIIVDLWFIWGCIFYLFFQKNSQHQFITGLMRWLLKGSILELLVAVPSHLIVRHRNDCCAPAGTFLGIATGMSIMLFSFGPGVFFLFMERIKQKKALN